MDGRESEAVGVEGLFLLFLKYCRSDGRVHFAVAQGLRWTLHHHKQLRHTSSPSPGNRGCALRFRFLCRLLLRAAIPNLVKTGDEKKSANEKGKGKWR